MVERKRSRGEVPLGLHPVFWTWGARVPLNTDWSKVTSRQLSGWFRKVDTETRKNLSSNQGQKP